MPTSATRSVRAKYPVVSEDRAVQARYVACRQAGSSHRVAEMLAFRQGPSLQTDTRWLSGHVNGSQFDTPGGEIIGGHYREVARRAGVSTEGAVYKAQLAAYPGDPRAWVRSKADVVKVAKERGMTLEGSVHYKPPSGMDDTPGPGETPYRVADSIVDHEYEVLCDHEPDAAHMPAAEVKETIRKKLSPSDD